MSNLKPQNGHSSDKYKWVGVWHVPNGNDFWAGDPKCNYNDGVKGQSQTDNCICKCYRKEAFSASTPAVCKTASDAFRLKRCKKESSPCARPPRKAVAKGVYTTESLEQSCIAARTTQV